MIGLKSFACQLNELCFYWIFQSSLNIFNFDTCFWAQTKDSGKSLSSKISPLVSTNSCKKVRLFRSMPRCENLSLWVPKPRKPIIKFQISQRHSSRKIPKIYCCIGRRGVECTVASIKFCIRLGQAYRLSSLFTVDLLVHHCVDDQFGATVSTGSSVI